MSQAYTINPIDDLLLVFFYSNVLATSLHCLVMLSSQTPNEHPMWIWPQCPKYDAL